MTHAVFADVGRSIRIEDESECPSDVPTWIAVARLGRLRIARPAYSVLMQVRGSCRITTVHGSFLLQRGQWISFARDEFPDIQGDRRGVTLGLALPCADPMDPPPIASPWPLVGRGAMSPHETRLARRLWRHAVQHALIDRWMATGPFLMNVAHLQQELRMQLERCPGRTFGRKRAVFEVLQRVRLHLEGNAHRVVRSTELSRLSGYSTWYLSKMFLHVYQAGPQTLGFRYRLAKACHLLSSTPLGIAEVGHACGFTCAASFSRAFRCGHGMSASMYRGVRLARAGAQDARTDAGRALA